MIPAAVGALLGLALIGLDFHAGDSTVSSGFGPSRPKPIPIPKAACPYLRAVRRTGNEAAAPSLTLFDPQLTRVKVDYPTGYAAQLASFEFSLRVAATQVPAKLRFELSDVAANVEVGRKLLQTTPARDTYLQQALDPLFNGSDSLADARDLVGNQCGFSLSDYAA